MFTTVCGPFWSAYRFFVCISLFFVIFAHRPAFGADSSYLDGLLKSAAEMRLSDDRYWEALLHYKHSWLGRKSSISDPKFFLSKDGKTNPEAELEATLKGFFQSEPADDNNPRCKFPARYSWLKEKLNIDETRLPAVSCARLNEVLTIIDPKSAVFIFPAAHVNSPTTMFGHTLLRINNSHYQSDLLSYAVSHAAVITDSSSILYGFKGVFGFYKGYFTILPYYEKVTEYNDMEHRDIWEYSLNLTEPEIRRMVYHVWELENIYTNYYFFDENCSYNLLFLLEAARPSLHLTDKAGAGLWRFWVIPSDTIRLVRESGLVEKEKYRPSQSARIHAIASLMPDDQQKAALQVAEGGIPVQKVQEMAVTREEKAHMLDLSTEILQYKVSRKEIEKEDYVKKFLAVLNARSVLGTMTAGVPTVPTPSRPEDGHRSGRMTMGLGYTGNSLFAETTWRAAYHDVLDPDEGYMEGSEIKFGEMSGRYYFPGESLKLQSLHIIDIVSFAPRDLFFKPLSWKVTTGFDREVLKDGEEHLIYRLNPGRGVAYKNSTVGLFYLMGEADLTFSNTFKNRYSVGLGASSGIIKKVNDFWKLHLSVQDLYYEIGEEHRSLKASLAQNFRITTNNSVTLSLSREKTFDYYQSEAKLGWNYYY